MSIPSTVSPTVAGKAQAPVANLIGGLCAIGAGCAGFAYSLAFIFLKNNLLIALFLMLGGLFALIALSALYGRVRMVEGTIARWAWALGLAGAFGALIHGGYDLANVINPPTVNVPLASLPSAIDPRGLLTFGIAGLGFFGFAWLIGRSDQFARSMSYLTYLLAILLVVLYLGRLILLNPQSLVIILPGVLSGLIVNPVWYVWLGVVLWRGERKVSSGEPA